jgi:drug/metabolite transporter (DMT)-like permease
MTGAVVRRELSGGAGVGLAVVSAAAFGTSGAFAASLMDSGWTPGAAVTVRVLVAAALLTAPALLQLRGHRARLGRGAKTITIYGIAAVAGAQLCYFNAVQHLPVAVALLLEYSGALLVVLWLWVQSGERPRKLTVAGGVLALSGLVLVLDLAGNVEVNLVGVAWGFGAAVGLATYFVLSAGTDDALPPLVVAWGGLSIGGAALLLAAAAGALPFTVATSDVVLVGTQVSWLVPVLGLSLLAAVVAYVAGIVAARVLGAKVASFVGLTEVLFAVVFAWLLLGQVLTFVQLVGGLVVLAGIALVRVDEPGAPTPDPVPSPSAAVDVIAAAGRRTGQPIG